MFAAVRFPETNVSGAQTLIQIYAANTDRPLTLLEVNFSCQGVDNLGAPIKFELCIQTTAGTGTSTTPVKCDQTDPHNIEATCLTDHSAEPTTTDILDSWFIHPQDGMIYQSAWQGAIKINGGDRIAVRLPDAPGAAVDITGSMKWFE